MHPSSSIDPSGSYFSSIISKNGRNEVQIYHLNGPTLTHDGSVKIELEAADEIIDSCWNQGSSRKSKRSSEGSETDVESVQTTLIVAVSNGDLLVFAPESDKIVARISNNKPLKSIASSSFQVVSALSSNAAELYQFSIASQKVTKTIKLPEICTTSTATTTGKLPHPLVVADKDLHVIDPTKARKNVTLSIPLGAGQVSLLRASHIHPVIYAAKSNKIHVVNTSSGEVTYKHTTTSEILELQVVSKNSEEEVILAITKVGVEAFSENHKSVIKSSIPIANVFYQQDLVVVWYQQNEPKLTRFSEWTFESEGQLILNIEQEPSIVVDPKLASKLVLPVELAVSNLEKDELYDQLTQLLDSESDQAAGIIMLCSSNNDSDSVKQTIQQLSFTPESTDLLNKLFPIVSGAVAADPSSNGALAIWLKWILLVHGGSIGKQEEQSLNLQSLERGLTGGLKLMPHLISLQGRLQLLKSQAALRTTESTDNEFEKTTEAPDMLFDNGEDDFDEQADMSRIEEDEEDEE